MIIFWGEQNVEEPISQGGFHCPNCAETRNYSHVRLGRWFAVYCIPLIRLRSIGEYVRCHGCERTYTLDALNDWPQAARRINGPLDPKTELLSGSPVMTVRDRLIRSGVSPQDADREIESHLGERRKSCQACKLEYHENISVCPHCGGWLGKRPAGSIGGGDPNRFMD